MANPFFIPRRKSPLLDYARLGLGAYDLYQRGQKMDIEKPLIEAKGKKALEAERVYKNIMGMGETPDAGRKPGETLGEYTPEQKTAITSYTGLDITEEEPEEKPWLEQPANAGRIGIIKSQFVNDKLDKAVLPMFNIIDPMIAENKSRLEIAATLHSSWPLVKMKTMAELQKELNKAHSDTSGISYLEKQERVAKITQYMNFINDKDVLNNLFPGYMEALAPERRKAELKPEETTVLKPEETLVGPRGREIARGLPAREKLPTDITTWVTPDKNIVNLPKGQLPPEGSVKYIKPEEPDKEVTNKLLKVGDAIIAKGMRMDVAFMDKWDDSQRRDFFEKRQLYMTIIQLKPELMNEIGIRKAADYAGIISKLATNEETGELIGWDEKKKEWIPIQ